MSQQASQGYCIHGKLLPGTHILKECLEIANRPSRDGTCNGSVAFHSDPQIKSNVRHSDVLVLCNE